MVDKRSYTEIVASLETHIVYINNHLGNIDQHLEKQNTTLDGHGNRLTALETTNRKPVNLSKKQAVSLGSAVFIFGSFVAGVLQAVGKTNGWW